MKILIVGDFTSWASAIERSYERAFQQIGCEVYRFAINQALTKNIRYGWLGRKINHFLPVEVWIRKANRELTIFVGEMRPNIVIIVGSYPVQAGTLAQIQSTTGAKLVLIWPDTLHNLNAVTIAALPIFDLIATYSSSSQEAFRKLGAQATNWTPLAGDPFLFSNAQSNLPIPPAVYASDISFIGGWRPEREQVLTQLCNQFQVKIWGPDWGRRCKQNKAILNAWQGKGLYGAAFGQTVLSTKINLNIIDPTNYPAANMRFFEIPIAGGLQVSSPCPEMEDEFKHGEDIFYYSQKSELPDLIHSLLMNDLLRKQVISSAYTKMMAKHTYRHRAMKILQYFEVEATSTSCIPENSCNTIIEK